MKKILITGALGQIGSELTLHLRKKYQPDFIVASDIRNNGSDVVLSGPFEVVDVLDKKKLIELAGKYQFDTIIHLAAALSAKAESNPMEAWRLNMDGLLNVLELTKEIGAKFFTPSSIGAFGPLTPKNQTPQDTIQRPITMYGINKVAGELLADYYHFKYGMDTRGIRFPGLISYITPPGGGTTDYAVEIFYEAIQKGSYVCYLKKDTYIDMMYMPDALEAIIQLLEADSSKLIHRNSFNVTAMSFSPNELATEITKHIPTFSLQYQIDPIRQSIADSWPNSIDASAAITEWGFQAKYDLPTMTDDMIKKIKGKLQP